MVVERPARQVGHLRRRSSDVRLTGHVREAHDRVRVRDVEHVAHERRPEWRRQAVEKHRVQRCHAVAIGVAQQRDAIRTRRRAAGLRLEVLEEGTLDSLRVVRSRRRVRLGHQHVAVRQDVQPPRMTQGKDPLVACPSNGTVGFENPTPIAPMNAEERGFSLYRDGRWLSQAAGRAYGERLPRCRAPWGFTHVTRPLSVSRALGGTEFLRNPCHRRGA